MSVLVWIWFDRFDLFKYLNVTGVDMDIQCLLCGTRERVEWKITRHFRMNHSIYGPQRQCEVCK